LLLKTYYLTFQYRRFFFSASNESFVRNFTTILELYKYLRLKLFWRPCSSKKLPIFSVIVVFISGQVLQNTPSSLVKCDSQLTADVIPYNNRNDGGPVASLLSLVEVPEKAIGTITFSCTSAKINLRFTKYLDFSVF
jgi:hypothetical protein